MYRTHEVLRAKARRWYVPYYHFYTPAHKTRSDHNFFSTPEGFLRELFRFP